MQAHYVAITWSAKAEKAHFLGIVLYHLRLMSTGAADISQTAQVRKALSQEKGFIGWELIF